MTQAFNLSQLANYVNTSGKLTNDGLADPSIPSGTAMLFVQTAAPTGWTKSTSNDNKALRIVSGTAGTGGSVGFTSAFGTPSLSGTVGGTALTVAQLPAHSHTIASYGSGSGLSYVNYATGSTDAAFLANIGSNNTGSGETHTHSIGGVATINVAYVDAIIATKN